MNKPNRLTVIAGAVGGLALVATAVVAVATSDDTPEPASSTPPVVQESASQPESSPTSPPASPPAASPDDAISPDQAVAIAEEALADVPSLPPVSEVEREREHGHITWSVEFGDDHEVYVDVTTGEVVKIERDDADHHDDHGRWDDDHDDHDDHDDWDDD